LAERQEEFDELAAELEAAERRADEIRRELTEEHEARVEELQSRIEAVEARAEEAQAEQQAVIDGLRAELTEAEERLEAARREAEMRAEQARREALAEREVEVSGLKNDLRQAEARAEEIAEEAREAYAQMLARMSEQLASIERDAAAEHEAALQRQQERIAELREQLEEAEDRAADARRLAREEYEGEIARSLAEAAAVDDRLEEVRDEARSEFEQEISALTEQLADAERRIEEARQAASAASEEQVADLESQLAEARRGGDEDAGRAERTLEFLRRLLDGIPYPVFFMDAERRYQSCNIAFARKVLGLPRSEVLGHTPEELREQISEELAEQLKVGDSEVFAKGEEVAWEARVHGPDGTMRSWAFRKEPYVEDGEISGITGAMIDISGLEAAERELEQERERSATVLERAPMIMAEISPEGVVSAIYGDAEELLGWSAGELVGRDWWGTLFPGELAEQIRDVLGAMRSGGDLEDRALELRTKSGEERVFSWSTSNVRTADRELLSILMVGVDITDRAREEEALEVHFREAVERVKKHRCLSNTLRLTQDTNLSLVEVLSGIVASLPEAWRYPGITTARGCVWGRERSSGESPYEPVASMRSEVLAGGEVVGEIEVRYHEERAEMEEGPFTVEERELLDSVTAHLGEMIERRSAEESLARLRLFRHSLIDQANLWLMALDRDCNVVLWNRAAERVSGYARNEVIGNDRVWAMLFPDPDYREEVLSRLREVTLGNTSAEDWETVVRARDGTERTVSWHAQRLIDDDDGSTLGAVALGRDITEHRAAASNT
ncbi:MAG: PAS domain S-box protein, partial [Armatimonadota bacterium]